MIEMTECDLEMLLMIRVINPVLPEFRPLPEIIRKFGRCRSLLIVIAQVFFGEDQVLPGINVVEKHGMVKAGFF